MRTNATARKLDGIGLRDAMRLDMFRYRVCDMEPTAWLTPLFAPAQRLPPLFALERGLRRQAEAERHAKEDDV